MCVLSLVVAWTLAGAAQSSEDEALALAMVSEARSAAGLPPLAPSARLTEFARSHSAEMVAQRALYHSAREVRRAAAPGGWLRLGENVGYGDTAAHVHAQFMQSPPHRDNILGDFTHIAVGVRRTSDGLVFVTMVFVKEGPAPQMVARRMRVFGQ